jgi:hypothetical protein
MTTGGEMLRLSFRDPNLRIHAIQISGRALLELQSSSANGPVKSGFFRSASTAKRGAAAGLTDAP